MSKEIVIPAIALRGMAILPNTIIHFDLSRKKSISAVENAMMSDQRVFLVAQRDLQEKEPEIENIYEYGTVALVKQVLKMPGGIVRILVEGMERGRLMGFDPEVDDYFLATVEVFSDYADGNTAATDSYEERARHEAMALEVKELFSEYASYFPKVGKAFTRQFESIRQLPRLLDEVIANLPIDYEKKQRVLSCIDVEERYRTVCEILRQETEIAKIRQEMSDGVKEKLAKNQKEYVLREQMNYIRKELGDEQDADTEADRFMDELDALEATDEIKERIRKEIKRYRSLSGSSSESAVTRGYIETLLEMPWDKTKEENRDLSNAEKVLNEDHYGLEKVKERMLEFLAVRNLTDKGESPIICLVGPPGTGKTSIARSIARALDKEYVRICLGGVRDEAEIRGHRRTYVGAMPGRIATSLKHAGVKNPLMLLDEIDKVSSDYRGDTSSALLEVLDSEQNRHFRDHYIELPIDLSDVLFVATANNAADIPRPLLDRMEVVEVSGYTENEKLHIAREHLMEKQLKKNGLTADQLSISDDAIEAIISGYVREAGVRGLERRIGELCRKSARKIYEGKKKKIEITSKNLEDYLGKVKYTRDKAGQKDDTGIVRGLAWTAVGGDTLEVEVNIMPGKGEVSLTGKLGDVMKESAMAGLSYIRSVSDRYGIKSEYYKEHDFHIHIPEGATPKDGPSAGITMATALLSAITDTPVRCDTAMTGEITLRGRVLPIGGLKEKLLAAKMAGIKQVLVPVENKKDVEEMDKEITDGLELRFVSTMDEVIERAMARKIKVKRGSKKRQ